MNREPHEEIRDLMRRLPADEPSMVWRAALDERVRAEAAKKRRWSLAIRWTPMAVASAACLVAFAVVVRAPGPAAVSGLSPGFEAALLTTHDELVAAPVALDPAEDAIAASPEFDASGL